MCWRLLCLGVLFVGCHWCANIRFFNNFGENVAFVKEIAVAQEV